MKLTDGTLNTDSIHTYSVAADISAGFDTRTVAAVGHTTIDDLVGNTNPNPNDGGADETLSPKIADRLSLPLETIEFDEEYNGNDQYMIHGTTLGRDIIRSSQLPKRLEKNMINLILY